MSNIIKPLMYIFIIYLVMMNLEAFKSIFSAAGSLAGIADDVVGLAGDAIETTGRGFEGIGKTQMSGFD